MAAGEQRIGALETQVDAVEHLAGDAAAVAATASREARRAQQAHERNIGLLNALRETQADHSRRFDRVDARFDGVDARLDGVDARLDVVDARLDVVGGTLGRLTAGMHTIESLLRRALDDDG